MSTIFKLVALGLPFILMGCASFSTFQTARVMEKNKLSLGVMGEYFVPTKDPNYLARNPATDNGCSPNLFNNCGLFYDAPFGTGGIISRTGLGYDMDLGVQLTLPFSLGLDLKYQFVDWEGLSLATGTGLIFFHTYPRKTYLGYDSAVFTLVLPLYLSYDLFESLSLYTGFKFIPTIPTYSQLFPQTSVFSASGGIKIGQKKGIMIEGTWAQASGSSSQVVSVGAALFIHFFPNIKKRVQFNSFENP